jgi:hypothetical protein
MLCIRTIGIHRELVLRSELEAHAQANAGGERHGATLNGRKLEVLFYPQTHLAGVTTATEGTALWLRATSAVEAVRLFASAVADMAARTESVPPDAA